MKYYRNLKNYKNNPIVTNAFLTILILIILQVLTIKADAKNQKLDDVKFKHLNVEDGLTHHETLYVYQDSQGFLWFGTKYGLNKYDGMTIKPYFHDPNHKNKNSLVGNFAHWIQEDSEGALWISTWGDGISKYDPKLDRFTNYRHDESNPNSLASNNVWSLFVDSKGSVWSATDNGVSILNPKTKSFLNYHHDSENPKSLSHNMVSRIREDAQGIYWISTYGGGLNRFDPESNEFMRYKHNADHPDSISNNNLWGVFVDSSNRVWIASENGLNLFHPETETFTSYQHDQNNPESLSSNTITVMCEDRHGKLWLGTFGGGLNRFDSENNTFNHFRHDSKNPFSLSNDIIMGVWEAQDGAIWVATYGGIDKYDPGEYQFEYYKGDLYSSDSSTTTKIRSVFQDKNGYIWIGTGGDGLSQLTKTRKLLINYQYDKNNNTSISDNDIWAITEDKNGHIWIGTHGGGLNQHDPVSQSFVRYKHDPGDPNTPSCNSLYDLALDKRRNVLWIAAYLTGLDKLDLTTKNFTHYKYNPNNPEGIVSNWVTTAFVDSKGFVWVGTEAGLSLFNPDTEKSTNFKHNIQDSKSLSANMIQVIYEDSNNNVWIGTSGGLNRYNEAAQSFDRFSQKDGLAGNHIAGIVEDSNGFLWISTDNGISKFNPAKKVFRNYNKYDGLQGNRFLMHSMHRNDQGELFFGGTNGFNIINPAILEDNQNIPKVVLTDFQIFNQSIPVGSNSVLKKHINQAQKIVLDHKQNVFSFEFSSLNFRNSSKNQYAYKMDGFDRDYQYTSSSRRIATYTNLDPGQYIFQVLGSNNDGLWNEKGSSLKVIIKPPWWKTLWFKFSLLILGLILVLSVFKYIHRLRFEITERKKIEGRLKENQYRLMNAQHIAHIGDWSWELKTNELIWSDETFKIFGHSPSEFKVTVESFEKAIHPDDLEKFINEREQALRENREVDIEHRIVLPDKSVHWVHEITSVEKDESGNVVKVTGTVQDITARKFTERELIESEKFHRSIIETAMDGFWLTDSQGNLLEVNKTYSLMSGYSEKELLSMKVSDLEKIESSTDVQKRIERVMAHGQDRFESKHKRKDETTFDVEIRIQYWETEGGRFICFLRDISELKIAEEKIQQTQKMESIGNLAGGIAHDFNNILFPIVGQAEILMEDFPEESPVYDSAQEIFKAGKRGSELVKQILSFSRRSEQKMMPVKIQRILKEVLKLSRSTIPADIEILEEIQEDCAKILAEPTQIHQVFMNLVTNAYHAIESNRGKLYVLLKETDEKPFREASSPFDNSQQRFALIEVRDTGIGIAPDIIGKIFDPYFTTKEKEKGTGLGLATVYGIVKKFDGEIRVFSKVGKGTTFKIYFPLIGQEDKIEVFESPNKDFTGDERILIVDDEGAIAKLEQRMLERSGYRVTRRTSSIDALEKIKESPYQFDLVVTDMAMPKLSGDALSEEILKIRPDMPIIICTGFSERLNRQKAESLGIRGYLNKPVVMSELVKMVREILDSNIKR